MSVVRILFTWRGRHYIANKLFLRCFKVDIRLSAGGYMHACKYSFGSMAAGQWGVFHLRMLIVMCESTA